MVSYSEFINGIESYTISTFYPHRGDEFRKAFSDIGTIRSLISSNINIMALTATATQEIASAVIERLCMTSVNMIGASPDRSNIKYSVKPNQTMNGLCATLAEELIALRSNTPKTVVFCQTLKQCGDFYHKIKRLLGPQITDPPGVPAIVPFRMISLFTSASRAEIRAETLEEFCKPNSTLRMIVATTAFGLGVDCHCIRRVINWDVPRSLEELVQESGRAGRDGSDSETVLCFDKAVSRHASKAVKNYVENTSVCRRKFLFKDFLFTNTETQQQNIKACACCDLCALLCNCQICNI